MVNRVKSPIGAIIIAGIFAVAGVCSPADANEDGAVAVPVAFDARVAGDGERTRFVADLTAPVPVRAFALADPYRVIVDLPQVTFRLAALKGSESRGLITAYRYGLFAPGKSRIVLDVSEPVKIEKALVHGPEDGQPARLVLALRRTDDASFREQLRGEGGIVAFPKPDGAAQKVRPDPVPENSAAAASNKPVIMIDPGHGGVDPGAVSRSGLREKDVVLEFARALKKMLEATGAFTVVMTREDDSFVALDERVALARQAQAALFISIHADSFRLRTIGGATVYTLSERASDADAAALAARENRADIVAGLHLDTTQDAVTDILLDLIRRETKNLSVQFARSLVGELDTSTRMNKNPHRYAGFKVLRAPDVPSVLIELGYISNKQDEKRLSDPAWRTDVASAVARSVEAYLQPQLAGATQ